MRPRRFIRTHFKPLSDAQAAAVVDDRDYIPRVYGAAPAIVFEPQGPMESVRRVIEAHTRHKIAEARMNIEWEMGRASTTKVRKVNRGWEKFQAMINGAADKIHGYDDGECMPQYRIYTDSDTRSMQ